MLRPAKLQIVEAVEAVRTEVLADEQVVELEELHVGSENDRVVLADVQRQVVGDLDDVLVQVVGGRETLGAGLEVTAILEVDAHRRDTLRSGSRALDRLDGEAELIELVVTENAVELGDE